MKAVARGHIDLRLQRLLQKELDADQVEQRKFLRVVVVDEQVEIALRSRVLTDSRAEHVKRRRPARPEGAGVAAQAGDGFAAGHASIIYQGGLRLIPPPRTGSNTRSFRGRVELRGSGETTAMAASKLDIGLRQGRILCQMKQGERLDFIAEGLPLIFESARGFWAT